MDLLALLLKERPIYRPWIIRAPAAMAGVLTVWGLYLFVSELFGVGPGLVAALLLATSTWHITYSRLGFRAILAPLLLVWSIWLLLKAFREAPKTRDRHPSIVGCGYAAAAAIVYALGFYTYIAYRITPFLLLLLIACSRERSVGFWKKTTVLAAVTFIVVAPIGWYFCSHPGTFFGRTSQVLVMNAPNPVHALVVNLGKEALMFNVVGDRNQNLSGAPELFFPVGVLFLFGIGICLLSLVGYRRGDKRPDFGMASTISLLPPFAAVLTLAWLALGIIPAAMSDEGIPHALRSILSLPPAMVLAAIGGTCLYRLVSERWHRPTVAKTIAGTFFAICLVFAYYDYFVRLAENPNVERELNAGTVKIGDAINALPASTPKYVVVNPDCDLARGIPVAAQTVMFITHSFSAANAEARNIHYIIAPRPGMGTTTIPIGASSGVVFYLGNELDNLNCP